jgi:hypothetical protein
MVVQITTAFPSVPQMPSAFCPGVVTGLHLLYCHVSVRLCWLLTSGPDQEENTTRVLITIDGTVGSASWRICFPPDFRS